MSSPTFTVRSKAVQAGAGAGKTYNLTHRVLDYVSDYYRHHQRFPHVMVTTFTIKATQELSERLIKLAFEKYPELVNYVSSPGYLTVSTIHGVLDKFLKKQGHRIGLHSDFSYLKKTEVSFHSKKLLKTLIEKTPDYQKLLSDFSFRHLHSMLMTSLKFNLHGYHVLNEEHLLELLRDELADKRSSLDEFSAEIASAEFSQKWVEFGQSLSSLAGLLDVDKWDKNYPLVLELLSNIKLNGLNSVKSPPEVTELYERVGPFFVDFKEKLRKPIYDSTTFSHIARIHRAFAELRAEFAVDMLELKKTLNKVELADLEILSLQIIRQFPDCAVQFSMGKDFWLIDEFQDTSPVQVEILNALVGTRPYYLVGDPQQSIYLFRGARSEVFHDKLKEIKKIGGEEQILDTNYRSSAAVLSLINQFSKDLGSAFKPLFVNPDKTSETKNESSAHFCLVNNPDPEANVEEIQIEKMTEHILKSHSQGVRFEDMSILVRKNDHIEEVASYLRGKNIPVHAHSSGSFWKRREIKDAISLLKFFVNPLDDLNLIVLLRTPFIAVSEQKLAEVMGQRKISVWSAAQPHLESGDWGESGKRLHALIADKDHYGLRALFLKAVTELGIFDFHLKYDPSGRAEGNIWKFIHLLKTFEDERGASYIQFLNEAEFSAENESAIEAPGSVSANKVNIMTVHAAKGLEFEYLYLPFMGKKAHIENKLEFMVDEEDRIWSLRTTVSEEESKNSGSLFEKKVLAEKSRREIEEDSRVFYVAYTRAKKFVYLSWATPADPGSWASKISMDLTPGEHQLNDLIYTVEEVSAAPALSPNQDIEKLADIIKPPYQFRREDYFLSETPRHQSVTSLVTGNQFVSYQKSFVKKRQGTLFHRLLELLRYPENTSFSEIIPQWFPEDQEEVATALQYILDHDDPPYVQIIKKGFVEWPFVLNRNDEIIEGQVDLWGIVDGKLWVVDYKSGSKVLQDKAFEQLRLYADALREYLKWQDPIQLVVVYPFLKEEFVKTITATD